MIYHVSRCSREFIHWLTAEHAEGAETYLVFWAIFALSAVNYEWPYWAKLGLDSPVAGWCIIVCEGLQSRDVHGE